MTTLTFGLGDIEADRSIPRESLRHMDAMDVGATIFSSHPLEKLQTHYGDMNHRVWGTIDQLFPFKRVNGEGDGWTRLQQRVTLLRLTAMVRAGGDVRIVADTDYGAAGKKVWASRLKGYDAYTQTLPHQRAEAPNGWYNDLGFAITEEGTSKVLDLRPAMIAECLNDHPGTSVHGLLYEVMKLAGVRVNVETMGGFYLTPNGLERAYYHRAMDMDDWANSGWIAYTADGERLGGHFCLKTAYDLGPEFPKALWFRVLLQMAIGMFNLPVPRIVPKAQYEAALAHWQQVETDVLEVLTKKASIENPLEYFSQNRAAMQAVASHFTKHGVLPEPKKPMELGPNELISVETVRHMLWAN